MALRERVSGCTLCDLSKTRTQTVFGVGNQAADWLVIGEAPGAEEDRQGEPFVGRAGQLLNAMLLAIGLAGCNSEWQQSRDLATRQNTTPPISYRSDIIAFMQTYLNDPTQIRDAAVSEPALKDFDNASRYAVCVRYNARNSNGQYAGPKESLVLFRYGRLDRIVDNAREACKDAAFQPFPELEQLTR